VGTVEVVLNVETMPELRDPVLVIAIRGWVDAGDAGALAAAMIEDQLGGSGPFATYDLRDLVDLQQTRPNVSLEEGMTRHITWPMIEFVAGHLGRDVVLCRGPEPSLRWPTITHDVTELAQRLGVTEAIGLGGMPAVASHRRPLEVLATATAHSLAQEVGAMRADYNGPTGIQTVLQVELGEAGIPTVGLWAQVPHYVAGNPCPPAVRALLEQVRAIARVDIDLSELDADADSYAAKVEEGLAERPDVAELVTAIESETEEEVSGDAIAAEIERFLRDQ
jgi:predicted ATP-grasp superfamily ATP-dependent carboligase